MTTSSASPALMPADDLAAVLAKCFALAAERGRRIRAELAAQTTGTTGTTADAPRPEGRHD